MNRYLPSNRTKWTNGFDSQPVWPSEPNVAVIKALVASALRVADNFSVQFFAEGAYHKLYEVSDPSWSTAYIFRVAVPILPFYKLESEMATLEFLRQRTSIPVPNPIAWSSSAEGKLGYEWALLEKLPGVQLLDVWNDFPWDKKLETCRALARYLAELWKPSNRFSQIGSIYFKKSENEQMQVRPRLPNSTKPTPEMTHVDEVNTHGFTVGPAVDPSLFDRHRLYLRADQGPYSSCHDWVESLIQVEERCIRSADLIQTIGRTQAVTETAKKELAALIDEVGGENDQEEWTEKSNLILKLCKDFRRVLPQVFPQPDPAETDEPRFCLFHCDIREANILVDPDTFAITGIIDWETAFAVPDWYGVDYPLFLNTTEPLDDEEPPIPITYDTQSPDYNGAKVSRREWWEAKQLRDHFDLAMEQVFGCKHWRPMSSPKGHIESEFRIKVLEISDYWTNCRSFLEKTELTLGYQPDAEKVLQKAVSAYLDQRRWKEAEDILAHCLKKSKVTLGTQDPSTLRLMATLGLTLRRQDRWDEAERLETQVWEARKRLLGQYHPDTLDSMSELAETHTLQGQLFAARRLEGQVYAIRKRTYEKEHPATVRSMGALAKIYSKLTGSKRGGKLLKRVVKINQRLLEDDHPDTLNSMTDLACHFDDLGLFIEAEALERRVLEKRKRLLGDEHPDTLMSMASLASLCGKRRQFSVTLDMQVHVLETRERLFGAEHCDTLNAMADLASTYFSQRRLDEAEELQLQVLETRKKLLGDDHPKTLSIKTDLAATYSSQYEWHKAMPLTAQVLKTKQTLRERRSLLQRGSMAKALRIGISDPTDKGSGSSPESTLVEEPLNDSGCSSDKDPALEFGISELFSDSIDASGGLSSLESIESQVSMADSGYTSSNGRSSPESTVSRASLAHSEYGSGRSSPDTVMTELSVDSGYASKGGSSPELGIAELFSGGTDAGDGSSAPDVGMADLSAEHGNTSGEDSSSETVMTELFLGTRDGGVGHLSPELQTAELLSDSVDASGKDSSPDAIMTELSDDGGDAGGENSSPEIVKTDVFSDSGNASSGCWGVGTTIAKVSADSKYAGRKKASPATVVANPPSTNGSQKQQTIANDAFAGISEAELISVYILSRDLEAERQLTDILTAAALLLLNSSQSESAEQEKNKKSVSSDSDSTCVGSADGNTDCPEKSGNTDEEVSGTGRMNDKRPGSDLRNNVVKKKRGLAEWYKSVSEEACTVM